MRESILYVFGALQVKVAIKKILIISVVVILEAVPGARQFGASRADDVPVWRQDLRAFSDI